MAEPPPALSGFVALADGVLDLVHHAAALLLGARGAHVGRLLGRRPFQLLGLGVALRCGRRQHRLTAERLRGLELELATPVQRRTAAPASLRRLDAIHTGGEEGVAELALLLLLVIGLALITAVLDVVYRDVGYVVNSLLLVFFWLTPIVYPLDRVSAPVRRVLLLSPATSILSCLRDVVMGGRFPPLTVFSGALAETLGLLVVGGIVYRRYERTVPDHV